MKILPNSGRLDTYVLECKLFFKYKVSTCTSGNIQRRDFSLYFDPLLLFVRSRIPHADFFIEMTAKNDSNGIIYGDYIVTARTSELRFDTCEVDAIKWMGERFSILTVKDKKWNNMSKVKKCHKIVLVTRLASA